MFYILFAIIGGAVGWFGSERVRLPFTQMQAGLIGAAGGLVGGVVLKMILPLILALLGAAIGAGVLLMVLGKRK